MPCEGTSIFDEAVLAEFGVEAAACEQFCVATAFSDASTFKHEDLVGVANGGKAVGYDETGAVFHEVVEGLLYETLGSRVHAGCGFVQDENGRIF